jgi:hypothetical protein
LRNLLLLAGLAAILMLAASGAAHPASAGGPPSQVYSLSNVDQVPTAATALVTLNGQRGACSNGLPGRVPKPQTETVTFVEARAALGRSGVVDRVLGSAQLKPRGAGDRVAFAGLARGKGGVALLGFLAEAASDPTNPLPFLNAGVVASRLGAQQAAWGLLDAAARRRNPDREPMGIDVQALIANARGVVLFRLHHFSQAETLFRTAVAREPLLAEARRNLAASLLCQGKVGAAIRPYELSLRRDPGIDDAKASRPKAADVVPVPGQALDLSHGVQGKLPKLKIPQTSDAGAASASALETARRNADEAELEAEENSSRLSLQVAKALRGKATALVYVTSINALLVDWQADRPDLGAAYDEVKADGQKLLDDYRSFWLGPYAAVEQECSSKPTHAEREQCEQTDCAAAVAGAHASWLPDANAAQADVDAWASRFYEYATALAANLKTPAAGQTDTEVARSLMYAAYSAYLVTPVANWAQSEEDAARHACGPSNGDDVAETDPADLVPTLSCPDSLKTVKFGISIGLFGISLNCESISVEGSALPSAISPFASLQYKFFEGTTTAFVGAKAGVPLDPLFAGKLKAGAYVTFDGSGTATDCGVRVTAEAGAKQGPISFGPTVGLKYEVSMADALLR